jgi:microcystin-dependent protein
VFLIGQTIGKTSGDLTGEDYNELFELAKNWTPNLGNEDWNAGHLVTLPDMRGRALVAADNMGGTSANRIAESSANKVGDTFGIEARALTSSQLPTHTHTLSGNGSHKHTIHQDTHTHKIRSSAYQGSGAPQSTYPYFEGRARPNYQNTIQSSVLSDSHNHGMSNTGHTHTIEEAGSSAPVTMTQPSIVFNVEMKY